MEELVEFESNPSAARISLTPEGTHRRYADDVAVPADCLLRPWTDYVEQALRAKVIFKRNIHYVVIGDEIRIVDATTGRIFEDRSWQQGLHQAVEAREDIPLTAENRHWFALPDNDSFDSTKPCVD